MVDCPLCDYSGTEREVKAHISGSQDAAHSGFAGSDFRGYFGRDGNGQQHGPENGTDGASGNGAAAGNGLPEVRCGNCQREVKYPELMPFKATCPGCGRKIREREAFEALEKKADERGKDEQAEPVEV